MVAVVATVEPEMAPKAAQARMPAIAMPPLKRPSSELAKSNSAFDKPPLTAKPPISMNSGITDRSYTDTRPYTAPRRCASSGSQPESAT